MDRIPTEELKLNIVSLKNDAADNVPMDRIPTEELKLSAYFQTRAPLRVPMDRIPTEELKL